MIKSYAIISDGKGHSRLENIVVRPPDETEILVEVKAAGICRTDINKISRIGESFIPGHEGAGLVLETGNQVTKIKPGDRVLLNWAMPCNACYQCDLGNQNLCETNSPIVSGTKYFSKTLNTALFSGQPIPRLFNLGTFSKHTVVKESAVTKIDADIPYPLAGIVSCSVLTGFGSVVHTAKVSAGSSVAVIGCGGIGMNVIQSAKLSKAKTIIAIDTDTKRLNLSKTFGSTHQLLANPAEPDLQSTLAQIKALTDGRGTDFCFECTDIPALSVVPLAMIRHGGTAVQISGVEQELTVDMSLFEFDKKYINPLYGNCIPEKDIPRILSLYQSNEYKLEEQITQVYPLEDFELMFKKISNKEVLKGVFIIS